MNLKLYLNRWFLFTFFMLVLIVTKSMSSSDKINYFSLTINLVYLTLFYIVIEKSLNKGLTQKRILKMLLVVFPAFFLLLFKLLYYNETGDFWETSAKDSLQYDFYAKQINEFPSIIDGVINYINNGGAVDDLGAILSVSLSYNIYESPITFNLLNLIAGYIASVALYRMSLMVTNHKYAFLTAVSYGLSSFVLYSHSTGMKESIFVMLVVLAFEKFAAFQRNKNTIDLFLAIFFLGSIYFFRPAVLIMILGGIFSSFVFTKNKSIVTYLFILVFIVSSFFYFDNINQLKSKYYSGSEQVAESAQYYSGLQVNTFTYTVSSISGLFGPLPSYFPTNLKLQTFFYSTGLGFRLFLGIFFWLGVRRIFREKTPLLVATSMFVNFEIASLILILEAFELRLNLPHLPFVFLISFWYLHNISINSMTRLEFIVSKIYMYIFAMLIIYWNFRI